MVGGTWGAVILQTPRKYLLEAIRQLRWMLIPPAWDLLNQAERLQGWAVFARQQGLLALENQADQESDEFTRQGLTMIVDGVSIEDIRMLLEADIDIGRRAALRQIGDVKGDQRECEDVLDVAVAIARADGEIEAAEEAMLKQIAEALGLRYDA